MRILVIGGHGQLGRSLAEVAGEQGAGREWQWTFVGRREIDLARAETIAPALEHHAPDIVINAAAYTAVDRAEDEPNAAFAVNAAGAGHLAAVLASRGGRLIHVSTDYVFDGRKASAYVEGDPIAPHSVYGRSKAAGEDAVRAALASHVIVRTAWVHSPFGQNFPKTMLRLAAGHQRVRVVADQWGNPTAAHDLARGLVRICDCWQETPDAGTGETFHLAGEGDANWAEVARAVFAASRAAGGAAAEVDEIGTADWPAKAPRPLNSRLCSVKFADVFGFRMPDWRRSLVTNVVRMVGDAALSADGASAKS